MNVKEQIRAKMEELREEYDYNWSGEKTASIVVSTHDGFECELPVLIIRGGRVIVEPMFGYLETEGDIQKDLSSERDVRLLREFDSRVYCFCSGLRLGVEASIGVKNPKYDSRSGMDIFRLPRAEEEEYINQSEVDAKIFGIREDFWTITHEDEYTEYRLLDYALRSYLLADLEVSFCKRKRVVIPINYKNRRG